MEVEYPDDFRCPISLELMTDPVIVSSGHTFDRASIQRWLDSGNRTCPLTMLPLHPQSPLIPNIALRRLISSFAPQSPTKSPSCHSRPTAADPDAFSSDPEALSSVLRLANRDPSFRRLLSDSGAAAALLRHAGDPSQPKLQELSLRLLLLLSLDGDDARVGLAADGAVDALCVALRHPEAAAAAVAATLLTSIATVDVNKCSIAAHPSAVPALAALLRDGDSRGRREAATALFVLCSLPDTRRRAAAVGAVPPLSLLAANGSDRAVQVLALLAKCPEGRREMFKVDDFIGTLGGVVRSRSPKGVEHALYVLNLLCLESAAMRSEARREGFLEICFDLVEKDDGKIGKNAMDLAQTLEKL